MFRKIKYLIARKLDGWINQYHLSLCYTNSIAPENTFMKGAAVSNFQNAPEKIKIGGGTVVRGELLVFANGGKITVGSHVYIGESSRLWSAEEIVIGDHVLISHNVNICDTNSHEIDHELRTTNYRKMLKDGHPKEKGEIKTKAVFIGKHAWIGFNSVILKGVTIGEGAIVSAGSVVTENVPEFCIVSGNPATIIKKLEKK